MKMLGHLAVNRASRHPARTIKLVYTPSNASDNAKHHIFVGKGLTYDSGGLDIKTGGHMKNMKTDKAGAMTLIGLFEYLKKQGSKNRVTAYLAIAENMIDGTAYKADDVLVMKNGKTVEVLNTDGEGRIVMADNLCLAQEENRDITNLYTIATLTGAKIYQFGKNTGALVGYSTKKKRGIIEAGKKSGEIFMNAEFNKYMMNSIDGDISDYKNLADSSVGMGCQTAGLFLTKFITKRNIKKFVHIDIAGAEISDKNATGFGVRTLIQLIKK